MERPHLINWISDALQDNYRVINAPSSRVAVRIYTTAVTTGDTQGNLHLITVNDGFVYHPRAAEKISLNIIIDLQTAS